MSYSKIVKNASIYTVFSVFSKSVNFLLLPLYTSYLTTADYGIVGIVTALTAFLSIVYTLSLAGSINRFYVEYKRKNKILNALYSTIFITVILNATFWTFVSLIGSKLFNYLIPNIDFFPYIFWGIMTVWLLPIYLLYQRILQARQNGKKVAFLNLSYTLINIALTVIFIVVLKQKAEGVIKAQTITALIMAVLIFVIFLRKIKWNFSSKLFKRIIKYSLPLIPHSLAGVSSTMIDRFVINKYLGASEVGIYNIAYQFGNISNVLTSAFNQAYVPWFNEQVKENRKDLIKIVALFATIVFSLFSMGISLFSEDILKLFAKEDFLKGAEFIPYLAFAYALNGVYYIFATDLFYDITGKGVRKLALITISSALINLVLNIALIPTLGILGAAVAFVVTKLSFAFITGLIAQKKAHAKINIGTLISIVLVFFAATLLILNHFSFLLKLIVYTFLFIFFIIVLVQVLKKSKYHVN